MTECPICRNGRLVEADDLETGERLGWECDNCRIFVEDLDDDFVTDYAAWTARQALQEQTS